MERQVLQGKLAIRISHIEGLWVGDSMVPSINLRPLHVCACMCAPHIHTGTPNTGGDREKLEPLGIIVGVFAFIYFKNLRQSHTVVRLNRLALNSRHSCCITFLMAEVTGMSHCTLLITGSVNWCNCCGKQLGVSASC